MHNHELPQPKLLQNPSSIMAMSSFFLFFLLSPLIFFAFPSSSQGIATGQAVGGTPGPGIVAGQAVGTPGPGLGTAAGQAVGGTSGPGIAGGQIVGGTPGTVAGQAVGGTPGPDTAAGQIVGGTPSTSAGQAVGGIATQPGPGDNHPRPYPFSDRPGPYPDHSGLAPAPGPPLDFSLDPGPDPALLPPIPQACRATNFTQLCETTLSESNRVPPNPTTPQIIQASIWIVNQDLKKAQSMIQAILHSVPQNVNLTNAAQNCVEYFQNAEYRIKQTVDALPRGRTKDARAYLSAAHTYEYDVWSALRYVNNSQLVNQTMAFTWSLIQLSSNALSMTKAYDVFGDDLAAWDPPKSERDGFWESDVGSDTGSDTMADFRLDYKSDFGLGLGLGLRSRRIGFPKMRPDVMVCKGGTCDYERVQDAVDAGPSNGRRYVIGIKEGIYDETVRVPLQKKNVVFLGDGMGKTVITGSKSVAIHGISTYNSGTVGVKGDGFMASGLTIQNTAGPNVQQAVAFVSDSDQSVIENCEFLGNQDTLYAHSLRQFYKSCRIVGNVDFIMGNSATVFQDCTLLIKPRQVTPEKGETNAVTAHGRIDPAQSEGFVFHNCVINGTQEFMQFYFSNPAVHKNYLGRPWKEFSRTVYINCVLGPLIHPEGWSPWTGTQGLATIYYGEFNSTGAGGNVTARVPWSNQIPPDHVSTYSAENFIQGHEWIPKSSRVSTPIVI